MSATFETIDAEDTEDPRMDLEFKAPDGETVTLSLLLTVDGDLRKVYPQLESLSEREALHYVAKLLFDDATRGM